MTRYLYSVRYHTCYPLVCMCAAAISVLLHTRISSSRSTRMWRRAIDVRDRSELKGIPKPEKSSGLSGTWDSLYYKFKTWVESCHKNAIQVIQKLESTVDVAITERSLEDEFPDGAELVSAQARQALISLTEGEALEIVKNPSRGTHFGLEALRRLLSKYEPQNPQANSTLLKEVLHPQQCSLDKLREGLESWEKGSEFVMSVPLAALC